MRRSRCRADSAWKRTRVVSVLIVKRRGQHHGKGEQILGVLNGEREYLGAMKK